MAYQYRADSLESAAAERLGGPLTWDLKFQIAFYARAEADFNIDHFFRPDLYDRTHFEPAQLAESMEKCVPRELHDLLDM